MNARRRTIVGVTAVSLGIVSVVAVLLVPTTIAEGTTVRFTYANSPAWQGSLCIQPGASASVTWFDSSLFHNASGLTEFGPLFTATVVIWTSAGGLGHPLYNSTGSQGTGSFTSTGMTHFSAFDTRSTEAVTLTILWNVAGHLLTGPDSPALC